MSGFNTIKKSRKRSYEIDEKLNVLNRELEKTKDIQEIAPTMHTGDLYTPVITTPPTEFQGPLDVPNTSGVGEEGFTQSSAGSGEEGHAPTYSSISDLNNSSVNRPVFQSPNDIEGAAASYGVVSYNLSGAGTNYGIILDGNIVEGILSGFVAGGTRPASYYVDIYEAYLATNAASPGYYTDEQIAEKRIHAARATSIESIRNSAIEKGLEFNIPWQGYRQPNMFADSTPYGTSYVHPTRGTLILAGFNLLGMAEKYHIGGDRGGTTAGDSKGTGDGDQYPPLPFGPEAFNKLNDEADQDIALPPAAILAAMAALGIAYKGAQSAWRMYQKYKKQIDEKIKQMKADGTQLAGSLSGRRIAPGTGGDRPSSPGLGWKWDQSANGGRGAYLPDLDFYIQRAGLDKASYEPKGNVLSENAYMALLHRDYRPNEQDYVKYGAKTPEDRKIFDAKVKKVLAYAKKRPDRLEYVMKRYPKNDPRLSMLNYKMDNMMDASDEYIETQFPTNQDLFTKVKERTKKNMNLTDPKNFKQVKDPIKYVDVNKTKKLKETVVRHFNKPVKSKSMFGLSMSKVKKTNQKMVEKREQEQRIKEEDRAYIEERMSRQKSNWKDDLTSL